ncbi:alkaline and neutral invertase-like protein [Mucilaginibacter gracilis]|uniref:beta-fructofuranosidase n=1 Tax=Mucilaginibacter gracilis TaxID=423350 RepID=A0A495J6X8_9SPHI|nr:glycoside hydrolase 100 family protein [Mucilaginibacter gracilis]RKR84745.1 alkaline and neutral invertase-like protein [Mucilaginibacter gracilis]
METTDWEIIEKARMAAIQVLTYNANGPFDGLPRTAGWGYPEPYTRDLMISILGIAVTADEVLIASTRRVLETLAENQTTLGHITSLVHDKEDRGASDTTPLFLLGVGIYRKLTGETAFLEAAVSKSLKWMEYQSPDDRYLVAQQPTSDWRDEQWVTGYGLYVNTLVYSYLRLFGLHERANGLSKELKEPSITGGFIQHHVHEGLVVKNKPYYAFWSYKIFCSDRFDLLGNSLAILSGLTSILQAEEIISWIEKECLNMKVKGDLAVDLPPNFFPFVLPGDADWHPRYETFNLPGHYHNGGVWPFICGFYIAALVAAGQFVLAEEKLIALTKLIGISSDKKLDYGFNEWIKAQDGRVMGQDWQTWSAALYLYAAKCVEIKKTPFFEDIRK